MISAAPAPITQPATRAVENITRKQLNPYEEAKAVGAMLDRGLSETGAAQALGWPKTRVSARMKVLERAQRMIGDGVIALAAVDQLRAIGTIAPGLLDAVIAYLDDGNAWAAERLAREPGWVLDAAMAHAGDSGGVFAAHLHRSTRMRSPPFGWARRPSSSCDRAQPSLQLQLCGGELEVAK